MATCCMNTNNTGAAAVPGTHEVEEEGLALCKEGHQAVAVELADLRRSSGRCASQSARRFHTSSAA